MACWQAQVSVLEESLRTTANLDIQHCLASVTEHLERKDYSGALVMLELSFPAQRIIDLLRQEWTFRACATGAVQYYVHALLGLDKREELWQFLKLILDSDPPVDPNLTSPMWSSVLQCVFAYFEKKGLCEADWMGIDAMLKSGTIREALRMTDPYILMRERLHLLSHNG